ncbi:MAG TPA: sugar nucleotide-binding protein, partial [Candidatus Saccharimonadales bacterium]|nr:sugar nucleotide-binding protein [Candidatus Saccharimonadales bacterium]
AASLVAQHYIVRTSWVIGDGKNFVNTMLELGRKGIAPKVVNDQIGRLTFTDTLAAAIDHLLADCPFGTYNVTNEGEPVSWADITTEIFRLSGYDQPVTGIPATAYFADNPTAAPRPLHSTLDLTKLQATGFKNQDWRSALQSYIHEEA